MVSYVGDAGGAAMGYWPFNYCLHIFGFPWMQQISIFLLNLNRIIADRIAVSWAREKVQNT
jgi:hypothetical protein